MAELKLKRKLFRMVGLLFPLVYVAGDLAAPWAGFAAAASILTLFLGIMFMLEYVRFHRPGVNRWLFEHFRAFTKEKEKARTSSTTLFLLSCFLTLLIFGKGVAIAAMLMLVFGDPVAEMVGTRWGRVPLLGKSAEGTLAGLAACLIVTLPLVRAPLGLGLWVIAAGALAASVFELIPFPVDDNFTIPLGAGAVMTLAQAALSPAGRLPAMSPLVEMALRGGVF